MAIYKSKHVGNYTVIPNSILQNNNLTLEAIGLLCHLLSLPPDWVVYKSQLSERLKIGRERFNRIFKELTDNGYIISIRKVSEDTKQFDYEHIVYDKPYNGEPYTGFPTAAKPSTANDTTNNIDIQSNIIQSNIPIQNNIVSESKKSNFKNKRSDKNFVPPTIDEVKQFFEENGYKESEAKRAFEYYSESGWVDSKENKVKNWKQKMRGVWFKEENKIASERTKTKSEVQKQGVLEMIKSGFFEEQASK
jgi:hypothetical protein